MLRREVYSCRTSFAMLSTRAFGQYSAYILTKASKLETGMACCLMRIYGMQGILPLAAMLLSLSFLYLAVVNCY